MQEPQASYPDPWVLVTRCRPFPGLNLQCLSAYVVSLWESWRGSDHPQPRFLSCSVKLEASFPSAPHSNPLPQSWASSGGSHSAGPGALEEACL